MYGMRTLLVGLFKFPLRSFGTFTGAAGPTDRPRKPGSCFGTPTGFPSTLRFTPLWAFWPCTAPTGVAILSHAQCPNWWAPEFLYQKEC